MQNFFPQLKNRIYFENSGGTQIPTQVSNNVIDFIQNNVDGPENEILDLNKNIIYKKVMTPGESLILNDRKFFHNVTPLKKIIEDKSFRDIFVLTTIS